MRRKEEEAYKENKSLQRAVVVLNNLIEVVDQSRISRSIECEEEEEEIPTTNLFCGSTQIEDLKDEEDHQIDVAEEVVFDSERNRNENEVVQSSRKLYYRHYSKKKDIITQTV